jgi:hypothetical protein
VSAAAVALLTAELLHFPVQSTRANRILLALTQAAPKADVRATTTRAYTGGSDLLVLWGPGAPNRTVPMRRQVEAGGHVLALDLAYWDRDRKFRLSIDAPHPQAWVMKRALPDTRLNADRVLVEHRWRPDGPVIVAGIGEKAGVQYGRDAVRAWELAMIGHAKAAGKRVLYRPKKQGGFTPNVPSASAGTIDQALTGASLVVTWHSNVAVDAIRLCIPTICRDGAAAAVCPADWQAEPRPLEPSVRDRFLANLAWFQWAPEEASACWAFVREALA